MGTLLVISEQEKKLVRVVPSERQMRHQKLEFYGFLHFTINTFTDREWGGRAQNPPLFFVRSILMRSSGRRLWRLPV